MEVKSGSPHVVREQAIRGVHVQGRARHRGDGSVMGGDDTEREERKEGTPYRQGDLNNDCNALVYLINHIP